MGLTDDDEFFELRKQIEELKKENEALKAELSQLRATVSAFACDNPFALRELSEQLILAYRQIDGLKSELGKGGRDE